MSLTWLSRKLPCDIIRQVGLQMTRMQTIPRSRFQTSMTQQKRGYCKKTDVSGADPSILITYHHPTNFDKRVLVYSKTFPSAELVPEKVTHIQMSKARDWFRIRVSLCMALGAVLGSFFVIYLGKKAAREGNTVAKQNDERHRRWKEEAIKKEEEVAGGKKNH